MGIAILTNWRRLKYHLHDPIFENTFLMANSLLSTGAGFFFRMLAAKLDVRWDMSISQPRVPLVEYLAALIRKPHQDII